MERLFLEGIKTLYLENEQELHLEYYLVEELREEAMNISWSCKDSSLYGIRIMETDGEEIRTEYTNPISYSYDYVKPMVHLLWKNDVTISTMLEIVDDLISELPTP